VPGQRYQSGSPTPHRRCGSRSDRPAVGGQARARLPTRSSRARPRDGDAGSDLAAGDLTRSSRRCDSAQRQERRCSVLRVTLRSMPRQLKVAGADVCRVATLAATVARNAGVRCPTGRFTLGATKPTQPSDFRVRESPVE